MKKFTTLLAVCALVFIACNSHEDKAAAQPVKPAKADTTAKK